MKSSDSENICICEITFTIYHLKIQKIKALSLHKIILFKIFIVYNIINLNNHHKLYRKISPYQTSFTSLHLMRNIIANIVKYLNYDYEMISYDST